MFHIYPSCSILQTYAPELYVLEATLDTLSTARVNHSSLSSSMSISDFSGRSRLPPIAGSYPYASHTGMVNDI